MSEFDCDKHKEDKDEIWACLSCYDENVAQSERERIIKLLQPEVTRHYELGLEASAAYLEQTIALIKGEQK